MASEMDEPTVRDSLTAERRATVARIQAMTTDFEAIVAATADSNIDDEHDPEGATVAFERAQVAALLAEGRAYLEDLDRALARLDVGTYWRCERCDGPITAERLAARPAAPTCIGCAGSRYPTRPGVRPAARP